MIMKKMYVNRKQLPLILAFAVTVHKCQSLSLDCALMEVFCPGMAYVALSPVKCLDNLYLTAFTREAIKVNTKCSEEITKSYRPDLPQYSLPREGKILLQKESGHSLVSCNRMFLHLNGLKMTVVSKKSTSACSKASEKPKKKLKEVHLFV